MTLSITIITFHPPRQMKWLKTKEVRQGEGEQDNTNNRNTATATLKTATGASLVVQWLRICLLMQRTWVWTLVQEWTSCAKLLRPTLPRAYAPQQEKPRQWEAHAPQRRPSTAKNKINNTSFKSLESFKEYLLITKRKNSNFTMEKIDSITVTKVIKINVNNHETYQHCVPPEIMKWEGNLSS